MQYHLISPLLSFISVHKLVIFTKEKSIKSNLWMRKIMYINSCSGAKVLCALISIYLPSSFCELLHHKKSRTNY